jgi:hypothetical protein
VTAEPELRLVETTPVEEKALSIVDQARAVKVTDAETYTVAGSLWKAIGDMIKEVKDTFDPICDAAHKAHKAAVEKRAKYLDPLTAAQKSVKGLMSAYDAEQERIRRAEQARIEAEMRKKEEERRIQEAIEAEAALKAQGAGKEEIAKETSAILETPVSVAPVVLPKSTPKLAGGPVYRTVWKARIINERLIPREYLTVDMVKINGVVRSLKGATQIPGIQAYEERV